MSINHLYPNTPIKLDIACNSCNCETMKIFDKLEVKDFTFDAQNGDKIELSTLIDKGAVGAVLKSDGNNGVLWGSDLTGGVNYTGSLPTVVNGLTVYNGVDGTTLGDTALTTQDIIDLQNDKVAKAGDTMTGNLTLSGTNELQTRFIQDNGGGLYGIEAKSLFKTPFGIRTTSIGNTNIGSDVLLNENLDCNNKQLRDVNGIYTSTLGTQAGLGGQITVVGGPINLNANSLTNVNNLQTQEIKATNGVSVQIQDDLDLNLYDINNCNDIRINALTTNTVPNILSNNNIDLNTNDLLDVGNMNVSTINNITPVGGLYCGISDGLVINQASGTTGLLPVSSVGSLVIPANGFQVGDAFHLVVAGIFPTENKNDDITIDVKQNGTTIASINLELEDFDTSPSNFELEMDFVIRSIGIAGSIATNLDFSFNKRVSKDFRGTRSTDITTIDTTTASTLSVLATVNGATSSIQSRLAYLRKQY